MIYFPGTIDTVSTRIYYYVTYIAMAHCSLSSCAHQLTLCMLVFSSREGVVFLVLLLSFHLTETHVLSPPESEANWRSPFWLWGLPPPSTFKMASSFTGSAQFPFPGYKTTTTLHNTRHTCTYITLVLLFISSFYTSSIFWAGWLLLTRSVC
jgi:hypothetical protein